MYEKEGEVDLDYFAGLDENSLFSELKSSKDGLSSVEAGFRLNQYGKNILDERKKSAVVIEFFKHFKSPLIIILMIAVGISAFFGEIVNATIIAIMILLSVVLDFLQEHSAEHAAEKLQEQVKTKADVLRGKNIEINIENVVPGDIIILNAGDIIPADCIILSAKDFFVNQSALTGESFPAEKDPLAATHLEKTLFMGTNVVSGTGTAIVVRTGKRTEFGKISSKLSSQRQDTEFERGVTSFGFLIMKATIFLVLFIFLVNSLLKHNFLESFLFAIAVAVGLTPELLPMIMSVNMAQCSVKMAKKGVIVKRLSAIPNFGGMDILCTDKTGTLTEDKIKLIKYLDLSGKNSEKILLYSYLNSVYHSGIQNPLDQAVLDYKKLDITNFTKFDEIPFDFVRKKVSVVVEESIAKTGKNKKLNNKSNKSNRRFIVVKGAPEEVLKSSRGYCRDERCEPFTANIKKKFTEQYQSLSKQGYRVLAIAIRELTDKKSSYTVEDEKDLELLGFIAFLDPPKADVKDVLKEIHEMGVEIKVVTGDNELVTEKVCQEIELEIRGILLGSDINAMTDDALKIAVEKTTIFARVTPDQKNRIIHALQSNNHVVGYMGDGINDAPSLKRADVGISVNSAVDVAKESASIVLTEKSLTVLKEGIIDGRNTFGNTMKYIMMGLSSNFGNMFSVAGAVLFLPFLPMLPVQILLNNFLYDTSQVTIPSDNVDKEFIARPKRWNMAFIKKFMIVFGLISSIFDFLTFIIMYFIFKVPAATLQTAWFMESLATQTLVIHIIRTKQLPFIQSTASKYLLLTSIGFTIIGWIIPYTALGRYFGFVPLPLSIVLILLGLVVAYLMLVQVVKVFFYRKNDF